MRYWFFLMALLVVVCHGANATTGFADSPVGPLNTVPPAFTDLAATPDQAMSGDMVVLTFDASKTLEADPSVFVNGNAAVISTKKDTFDFTFLYLVSEMDVTGAAHIEITGQDLLGNQGVLNSNTTLEILETPPELPLSAWTWFIAALLVIAVMLAWGGRRRLTGALLVAFILTITISAHAQTPEVSNVDFLQEPAPTGGTQVVVTYDLVADDPCAVYLSLSQDPSDNDFVSPVKHYAGAIADMTTGTGHQIVWDIARDYPNADFPEARIRVTADNDPAPHTLTYTAGENGVLSGPTTQTVAHGADGAIVTAAPNEHYRFIEWSDGVESASRQDVTVTTDIDVTAIFAPLGYGSIFLEGESVRIPTVHRTPGAWQILDDELETVASGTFDGESPFIDVGELTTGWYRVEFPDEPDAFTTLAVLAPLQETPGPDTPVAVDIAMSWATGADHPGDHAQWRHYARAAALAGVRAVRDRIRWRHFQLTEGGWEEDLKYDKAAEVQHQFGLQIVQTFHDSPTWTRDHFEDAGRVPPDLRHTWEFCRGLAERFADTVQIWQPWNEGNSPNFGGHTIDELCSHQKAAYWGFKTGNPDAIVSWAPLGGINSDGLCRGISDNELLPYFDIYSLHSYEWPDAYARVRETPMEIASGKPLWVTESDRGIPVDPASPYFDLTHENEQRKAQFMAQSIATSLSTGTKRNFHFLLRQYGTEIQFGLLRHDDTPRMTYVALAAAGRLLADAEYLGEVQHDAGEDVHIFAFRGRPDGVEQDVLVAWTELRAEWENRGQAVADIQLPSNLSVQQVWDYLGRPLGAFVPQQVTSSPLFVVMPVGETDKLTLETLTPAPPAPDDPPSPVVLQLRVPVGTRQLAYRLHDWASEHDRAMDPGTHELIVSTYNFGDTTVSGTITTDDLPAEWVCVPNTWNVTDLEPMERFDQTVMLTVPEPGPPADDGAWTSFQGNFGAAGTPKLAFRAMPAP